MAFKSLSKPTVYADSSIKVVNFNLFTSNNNSAQKSRSLEKDAFRSLSMERLKLYNEIMDKSKPSTSIIEEKTLNLPAKALKSPKNTFFTEKNADNIVNPANKSENDIFCNFFSKNKSNNKPKLNEFQGKNAEQKSISHSNSIRTRETPSKNMRPPSKNEPMIEKFSLCSPKTVQKVEISNVFSNPTNNPSANANNCMNSPHTHGRVLEIDLSPSSYNSPKNHEKPPSRAHSLEKKSEKTLHRSNSLTRNEEPPLYSPSSSKTPNNDVNYQAILSSMKQKLKSPKNNDLKSLHYLISPTSHSHGASTKTVFQRKNAQTPTLRSSYIPCRGWLNHHHSKEINDNSASHESKENIPPNQTNFNIISSCSLEKRHGEIEEKGKETVISESVTLNSPKFHSNDCENQNKKADFQEYKRLQEKLLFLENRIVEMKSNFESAQKTCFKECKAKEKEKETAATVVEINRNKEKPPLNNNANSINNGGFVMKSKERSLSQDKAINNNNNVSGGNYKNYNFENTIEQNNDYGHSNNIQKSQHYIDVNENREKNNKYSPKPPQPTQITSPKNKMILVESLFNNSTKKNAEKTQSNIQENALISLKSFVTQVEKGHFLPRELEKDEERLQKSSKKKGLQEKKAIIEKKTNSFTMEEKAAENSSQGNKKYNSLNKRNFYYISTILKAFLQITNEDDAILKVSREHFQQTFQSIVFVASLKPISQSCIDEKKVFLPRKDFYKNKKTLIFDLDETLIHCNENSNVRSDIVLPIKFPTGQVIEAGINIRPYTMECIRELANYYEIIVFTASHNCYANVVLDYLDPKKELFQHRLFREHCIQTEEGLFVKDLRVIENRPLENTLIIDNAAYSFGFQLDNGVPILPYYDNKEDRELVNLTQYLKTIKDFKEIREVNRKMFKLREFAAFQDAEDVLQGLYGDLPL